MGPSPVLGGEGRLPSGPSLDSQMGPWWVTPESGEKLPSLSGPLRTKSPTGHLISAHSGQAPDPTPYSTKELSFSGTRLQGGRGQIGRGIMVEILPLPHFPNSTGSSVFPASGFLRRAFLV